MVGLWLLGIKRELVNILPRVYGCQCENRATHENTDLTYPYYVTLSILSILFHFNTAKAQTCIRFLINCCCFDPLYSIDASRINRLTVVWNSTPFAKTKLGFACQGNETYCMLQPIVSQACATVGRQFNFFMAYHFSRLKAWWNVYLHLLKHMVRFRKNQHLT